MARVMNSNGKLTVIAYPGDAKTLIAINLDEASAKNLAGFTIICQPKGKSSYYLYNNLQFEFPAKHTQDPNEPAYSSINAPVHKFRWLHVPGSAHQGLHPFMGLYTYTVVPRYFDGNQSLLPIDKSLGMSVAIEMRPFIKGGLSTGFTRGFVQSQAFVRHFGSKACIQPGGRDLIFDTSMPAGKDDAGNSYTYAEEYDWLGFTAREQINKLLDEALNDQTLRLELFAYDLNEPDFVKVILQLAAQGRARVILDNAALHHNKDHTKMEDKFEDEFNRVKTGNAEVKRGKFGRYAHDKVIIISNTSGPTKVLTGSTNFAVTGFYVNSNHVLVFDDPAIATVYHDVFEQSWIGKVKAAAFRATTLAQQPFSSSPSLSITFSPHEQSYADKILEDIAARIAQEENQPNGGSVLFAVMQMDNSESTVYKKLKDLHKNSSVISYGISDAPGGIILHEPSKKHGILVSGKPGKTVLPAPFSQVPGISGHQIHHKFVICGFNRPDAVVYCGSSNLANGGENKNGDNLLAFYDSEVATVFAIEAIALVDHFQFLDRCTREGDKNKERTAAGLQAAEDPASPDAAVAAHWYLSTTDYWVKKYYDPNDLYCSDRLLFGQ